MGEAHEKGELDRNDRTPAVRNSADAVPAEADKEQAARPPALKSPRGFMRPLAVPARPLTFNGGDAPEAAEPPVLPTGPGPLAAKMARAVPMSKGAVGGGELPPAAMKSAPMAQAMRVPGVEGMSPNRAGSKMAVGGLAMDRQAQPAADALRRGRDLEEEAAEERQRAVKKVPAELQKRSDGIEREAAHDRTLERLQEQVAEEARKLTPPQAPPTDPARKAGEGDRDEKAAYFKNVWNTVPRVPPLIVREYAAAAPAWERDQADSTSPDTVLWQPVIVLPSDGKASLPLRLNADSRGYQVIVAGHTLDGRLGAVRATVPAAPARPAAPK